MADKTSIEWTDATWNPTRGCTKIAQGCKNCYAETFAERFRGVPGHPYERGFDPRTAPDKLTEPLKWKKPRRIFVDSMSDLFHESFSFEYIAACFGVMAACPQHTFQILTKRPERAVEFFVWLAERGGLGPYIRSCTAHDHERRGPYIYFHKLSKTEKIDGRTVRSLNDPWMQVFNAAACTGQSPLPNVWIGTSIATQADADANIPHLLQIPAAVRFLSVEPLLGPIEFSDVSRRADAVQQWGKRAVAGIDWIIVGGESGPHARPCKVEWVRSIVKQCKAAGVPVFVKQLGATVIDRSDAGFEGDLETYIDGPDAGEWTNPAAWPHQHAAEDRIEHLTAQNWQGDPVRIHTRDRKGGDWNEWPADLRVREFPRTQEEG